MITQKPLFVRAAQLRTHKIILFLYLICVGFTIIVGRLLYLQVGQNEHLEKLGERNFLRTEVIPSARGNFLDRKGNLLATNRPVFEVHWQGDGARVLHTKQRQTLAQLAAILQGEPQHNVIYHAVERAEWFSRRIRIARDISFQQLCQVCEQCADSPNLVITQQFKRTYPYGSLASHILGYLGREERDNFVGRMGLERLFHEDLKGEDGYVQHVINATGRRLVQKDFKPANAGSDVVLTLDLSLQKIAENLFAADQSGAFIVMDPHDGSILSLVSFPNFDSNAFLKPIPLDEWNERFTRNSPMLNRAIFAEYPPASIFKLITFIAGIEEGVFPIDGEFQCKGHTLFCGRKYNCQRRWGHGKLSATKALAVSCNIPCYEVAQKVSIDKLAVYAYRLGLGQRTCFLCGDKSGLVPTMGWKQAVKGERWWLGETLSASIGQSFLLVTPLQVARMIGAIGTGNLVKPRILKEEQEFSMPVDITPETLDFLHDVMREVVRRGTARQLNKLKNFEIYAKTGTAQTVSLQHQQKESKSQLEHAWFASYFSYKQQKPLVMIVLVENVGRSRPAIDIAEKFLREYEKVHP